MANTVNTQFETGFYWVRYRNSEVLVAECSDGVGCSEETDHWHIPGVDFCWPIYLLEPIGDRLAPPAAAEKVAA